MRLLAFCLAALVFSNSGFSRAGEKYAFLVGISGYDEKQLKQLPYASADIVDFRSVLLDSGFKADNIIMLVDDLSALPKGKQAGRFLPEHKKIREELLILLPALEPDDELIIGLAGHGVQFKDDSDPYFCPLDTNLSDKSTLISMNWLYQQLEYDKKTKTGCPARAKLLIVDACRKDPETRIRRNSNGPELASLTKPQVAEPPAGVVALFSCAEGQEAMEHDPLKHGVFFYHVLEGLKGKADSDMDQQVTLDEMIAFTKAKTTSYVRKELRAPQTPRQKGFVDGTWILRSLEDSTLPDLITNSIGMKLKLIPAGEFMMGTNETRGDLESAGFVLTDTFDNSDEHPEHKVEITKPFYFGIHEVTRGQFAAFVADTNYKTEAEKDGKGGWGMDAAGNGGQKPEYNWRTNGLSQTDSHPVVNVSWNDAVALCEWLSRKEGKMYRLPTEAEWEYSCKSGTRTHFSSGDGLLSLKGSANVLDTSYKGKYANNDDAKFQPFPFDDGWVYTSPVGQFKSNAFGLYDMHGNVWEWCSDWYDKEYYASSPRKDPPGATTGSLRVVRGGSWGGAAGGCRSASRSDDGPANRFFDLGFRLALSPSVK